MATFVIFVGESRRSAALLSSDALCVQKKQKKMIKCVIKFTIFEPVQV